MYVLLVVGERFALDVNPNPKAELLKCAPAEADNGQAVTGEECFGRYGVIEEHVIVSVQELF